MERKVIRWLVLAVLSFLFFYWIFGNWILAVAIMLMIGLHESGHLLMARYFGLKTGGFYFLPGLGGISLTKEIAQKRWQDFWIYFGGPFVGALLVLGLYLILAFFGVKLPVDYRIEMVFIISLWSAINFFNLLPIFPLDGGGMLWALAKSFWKGYSPNGALIVNFLGIIFFFQLTGNWIWVFLLLFTGLISVNRLNSLETSFEKQDMKWQQVLVGFGAYLSVAFFFAIFALWSLFVLGQLK